MSAQPTRLQQVGGTVRQDDIAMVRNLRLEKKRIEGELKEAELYIVTRLEMGAKVERGAYLCSINRQERRSPKWKEEFIRVVGQEAADALKKSAKPTVYTRLEIE